MFESLYQDWKKELPVLRQAPISFTLTLILAALLAIGIGEWRHAGQIEALEERIRMEQERVKMASPPEIAQKVSYLENLLKTGECPKPPTPPAWLMEPPSDESMVDRMEKILEDAQQER